MTSWNLQELRTLVQDKHGDNQLAILKPHLDSVDWKLRIASFHSYAYSETFSSFFDEAIDGRVAAIGFILSNGEEADRFREAKLVAEANIIVCAQSTHSVSDILSYVIVHALKLGGVDEQRMTLSEINSALPSGILQDRVRGLLGRKEYRYLLDFVNKTKHVSLVFSQYSVNLISQNCNDHGLKFGSFSYKDRTHPRNGARNSSRK